MQPIHAILPIAIASLLLTRSLGGVSIPAALAICFLSLLSAALLRGVLCRLSLALALAALLSAHFTHQLFSIDPDNIGARLADDPRFTADEPDAAEPDTPQEKHPGLPIAVTGFILDRPRLVLTPDPWPDRPFAAPPILKFTLAARAFAPIGNGPASPCTGSLSVSVGSAGIHTLRAGQRIRVIGAIAPLPGPVNPGDADPRPLLAQDNILARLWVESPALITDAPDLTLSTADQLRIAGARALAAIRSATAAAVPWSSPPPAHASIHDARAHAMLGALLLGADDPDLAPVASSFSRLGLIHALSISGFHVALLAGIVLLLVRLAGELGRLAPILALSLILLYTLAVPAEAPVIRSAIMIAAFLIARAMGRSLEPLALLGLSATIILLVRPLDLFDLGFQLSFGVTAALFAVVPAVHARLDPGPVLGVARSPLATLAAAARHRFTQALTVCLVAWLVSIPAIIAHNGVVSVYAVIVSLVALPLISLTLVLGYIAMIVGLLSLALGVSLPASIIADAAAATASLTLSLTDLFDTLPMSLWTWPAVPTLWAIMATALIVVLLRWPRLPMRYLGPCALAMLIWTAALLVRPALAPIGGECRVDELALPGGRCTLVRAGRAAVIIDCGSTSPSANAFAPLSIPRSLRALGCHDVRTLILTAPTAANAGAADALTRRLNISDVLISPHFEALARSRPGSPPARLLETLRARGVSVTLITPGDSLRLSTDTSISLAVNSAGAIAPHLFVRNVNAPLRQAPPRGRTLPFKSTVIP